MGIDFIRSKRQSRRKAWNFQISTGSRDLLANLQPTTRRTCRATVETGSLPKVGQAVVLQLTADHRVAVRDENVVVGHVTQPKKDLLKDLTQRRGMLAASVTATLTKAGTIDLVVED